MLQPGESVAHVDVATIQRPQCVHLQAHQAAAGKKGLQAAAPGRILMSLDFIEIWGRGQYLQALHAHTRVHSNLKQLQVLWQLQMLKL
jgi:hypothetical protein